MIAEATESEITTTPVIQDIGPHKTGPHIALCFCSRGVGHMPSILGAWRELLAANVPYTICPVFYEPIPDAQNQATAAGLTSGADYLWFLEDDQLLPTGVLAAMLAAAEAGHQIVTVDYRTRGSGRLLVGRHPQTGEVVLTPMGVLMVAREVFEKIAHPPFQADRVWLLERGRWRGLDRPAHVGQQDGFFSREVIRAGYSIHVLEGWEAGHLDLVRAGGRNNMGMDEVKLWGGAGDVPWKPPIGRFGMAGEMDYLRSPGGSLVIDMDPRKTPAYLKRGWTKITKAQYDAGTKQQAARAEARREEDRKEAANG